MFLPTACMWIHFQVIPCVTYSGQSCIATGLSPPSILMHEHISILVFVDRCTVFTFRVEVYLLQM
jgi:hypothetical protein